VRVVIDTNTLASGAIAPAGGALATLITSLRAGSFELFLSKFILEELARTLTKPYFRQRVSPADVRTYFLMIAAAATLVPITAIVRGVASHPEDDLILATAVSARAHYLVTGDRQLQALGSYQRVSILSPSDFVAL
jgi:putative PIN family toxin of toxin-antitoxin system